MKKIKIAVSILIAGIVIYALFLWINRYNNLEKYTERLLGIDWQNCIETSTGKVEGGFREEDRAEVRLNVKAGAEQEIENRLTERFKTGRSLPAEVPSGIWNYDLGKDLYNKEIRLVFCQFMPAKWKRTTEEIWIFTATDNENRMYVYVFK